MLAPLFLPAAEAALRLATGDVPNAMGQLYVAGPDGRLALAAAAADGPNLVLVAETLTAEATPLDLSGVTDAPPCGWGVAWDGDPRGAVLLVSDAPWPDGTAVRLRDAVAVLRSLCVALPRTPSEVAGDRASLLARMAHDLRSPLTALLGYAELLQSDVSADDLAQIRAVMHRASDQTRAAVDRLSALALVDGGRATPTPTRVGALLAETVDAHRVAAERAGSTLAIDVHVPDEPVLLDGGVLRHLLRTLVGAAVAATADGRIDGRLVSDGASVVFDLRAEPAAAGAGLGPMGVDLVHRLVALLGGTVDVSAAALAPGAGWRWTLRLPARPVPLVVLAPANEPLTQAATVAAG